MPKPPVTKPRTFPKLGHGGGSWGWDEVRRKVTLRFAVNGRRVVVRGDTTTECILRRDERHAAGAEETAAAERLANGHRTVNEVLDAWFTYHKGGKAPQTVETYERTMRIVEDSALGGQLARMVTLGDVEDFFLYVVDELDHGLASLAKLRSHLGMAFEHGMRHGSNTIDPTKGSKFPGHARGPSKPVWLDEAGFVAMRRYLVQRPTTVHVALLTGLLTGMRPGEVLGLCDDAVDLDAGIIHVKRGLQRSMGSRVRTIVDELKTDQSERVVEMPTDLVAALRHERAARGRRQLAAKVWHDSTAVFVRPDGKPVRFEALYWHCQMACIRLGIPRVSANKLRHTNASMLLDRGASPADVAKHLGHKDMRMVMTTYGHSMKAQVPSATLLAAEEG